MWLKQRQVKIILIFIVTVAFVILFYVRYSYINIKYPNPVIKEHNINIPFTYQGVELLLSDFRLLDNKEFLQEYELDPRRMNINIPGSEQKNAIVTLHVKNSGNTIKEIDTAELMLLETDGWASYTDLMDSFRLLNNGKSSLVVLNPGEESTLEFSYCIYDLSFSKKDFNNLDTSKFSMVLSLYPQKNIVRLN